METFFFADTDLADTLDLAFYLKEPLILGWRLAISVLQPLNFHLAMPNYAYLSSFGLCVRRSSKYLDCWPVNPFKTLAKNNLHLRIKTYLVAAEADATLYLYPAFGHICHICIVQYMFVYCTYIWHSVEDAYCLDTDCF